MRIKQIELRKHGNAQTVTAHIDNLQLWFRFPGSIAVDIEDATPFVLATLLPAMLFGEDLEVDDRYGVSPKLLAELPHIQSVYHTWNAIFKPVNVIVRQAIPAEKSLGGCSFFSGGVDGTYTMLKHRDEIDHVLIINGFDMNITTDVWTRMIARNRAFVEKFNKTLIPIETNHRSFLAGFGLSGYANFGTTLAGLGQLLGSRKLFISASDTFDSLMASGSHPLLDPHYSTERTEVIHAGLEADREGKIGFIKQFDGALANLWVCWETAEQNCGKCSKCVRSYVALQLNDIQDFPFKEPPNLADVSRVTLRSEETLSFFERFLQSARAKGRSDLAKVLSRRIFRYKLKKFLREAESTFLPALDRWRQRHRPEGDDRVLVSVIPRYSDQTAMEYARARLRSKKFSQEVHDIGSVYLTGG